MLVNFLSPILTLDSATIAGISLWSLALYLGLSAVGDRLTDQLDRGFDFVAGLFLKGNQKGNQRGNQASGQISHRGSNP
jgi:hypothetical protein